MVVIVNNQSKEVNKQETISGLLALLLESNLKGVAVAINDKVVPRARWNSHILNENDKVTIIKASQGG